ncbi:phosphatase PAP2 family protein [Streptomyces parvulus]|uniref:phosphatase PAP2 family protein n=1 Tax=Streptomyces parvulus TaxID=146923 RepID=UPI0036C58AFD
MTGERGSAVLPQGRRAWLGLVAVLAALVVVVLAGLYAGGSRPGAPDRRIGAAAEDTGPAWRDVALGVDFLGEPGGAALLVAAAAAGALVVRRPRAALLVVLGPALAVAATKLLKPLVGRTIHDGSLSFPSGHTAFLTAFALAVALLATGRTGPGGAYGPALVLGAATAAGAAMGWAQVVLGAHYPTDALGGWCTALAVTPATAWLLDRTADRQARRPVDATPPGPR